MRYFSTLLLSFLLFTNCNNSKSKTVEKTNRLELIPEPDKQERLLGEAIQNFKNPSCDFLEPDTSLCGIILRNPQSADKVIGRDNKLDESDQYHFYSKMDNETLTLTQHAGDGKNSISIFSVSLSDKADKGYKQLNFSTFQTEKGIKLGLSKQEVLAKLGNCYTIIDSTNDCIELFYRIENPKDSRTKILESNNMPVYYSSFTFCKNKLKHFEFGFEYP